MRRLIQLAAHIYPASWRRRYWTEFAALLEDLDAGWKVLFNVLLEALRMRMRTWSRGKILSTGVIAGLLAGFFTWCVLPRQYSSNGVVKVAASASADPAEVLNDLGNVARQAFSEPALAAIIHQLNLYGFEQSKRPFSDSISEMRKNILLRPLDRHAKSDVGLFSIEFVYRDPILAQHTTQKLVESLIDSNFAHHLQLEANAPPYSVEVLVTPNLRTVPVAPNLWLFLSLGLAAGAFVGTAFAYWRPLGQTAL